MQDSYTNPYESKRIESFEIFVCTKRIHETNLSKTNPRNESTIQIFKVRFRESETSGFVRIRIRKSLFLRIRWSRKNRRIFENWLDSWLMLQNESFKVRIRDPRYDTNLFKSGFVIHDTIRIFLNQDLWSTIWIKSF